MNSAQRNYCPTRRELLAVVASLQHFRHYLLGNDVVLRTDHHSLKWLETFKRPEGILARWIETLSSHTRSNIVPVAYIVMQTVFHAFTANNVGVNLHQPHG